MIHHPVERSFARDSLILLLVAIGGWVAFKLVLFLVIGQ